MIHCTFTQQPLLPQLSGRRIAFTTPTNYSSRLLRLLHHHHAIPIPIPTVHISITPQTLSDLKSYTTNSDLLSTFSALAFTSRSGISAFSLALPATPPLPEPIYTFSICALGNDVQLLEETKLATRIFKRKSATVAFPISIPASPEGMVAALGTGRGRKILCPVPEVVGLEEPPVVGEFVERLEERGWNPVRVPAYETRWTGENCLDALLRGKEEEGGDVVDAIVFTSTAEVEGFLKGLEKAGWRWESVRERWKDLVVATHGPVTKVGAERLGIKVDVVGVQFDSFHGVLEALASRWSCC